MTGQMIQTKATPITLGRPSSQAKNRRWMQALILRQAFRRAYVRFAESYPDYQAVFLNEHFLTHQVGPLLACYLDKGVLPVAFELVTAWGEQFVPPSEADYQRCMAKLLPAATDFLNWLEAELGS